jgi:hypothetical protein
MEWPQDQKNRLIEAFFNGNSEPPCPTCEARMQPIFSEVAGGWCLAMECPRGCGEMVVDKKDDPLHPKFREWTETEFSKIIDNHFQKRPSGCPVDGTRLHVEHSQHHDGTTVIASCRRCQVSPHRDIPRPARV